MTERMLHHFLCAYVGPESDFRAEEALICPKCSRPILRDASDWEVLSEPDATSTAAGVILPRFLARSSGSD